MADDAVVFQNVTYRYRGTEAPAVRDVSLRIRGGEYVGLIGPNGAGKTTLIRLMMGVLSGYQGDIRICGMTPEEARRRQCVGYLPQRSAARLDFPVSCRQVIAMAPAARRPGWARTSGEERDWVDRCVEMVGATAFADRPVGSVSGGQLQRVLIGRALAVRPRVLVFDEPTNGIDAVGRRQFADLLESVQAELGLTILLVSHDIRAIVRGARRCDRVACLRQTLHFHESPGGLTPQVLGEVFEHDLSDVFGEVHVVAHPAAECDHDHHSHGGDGGGTS